MAGLRLEELVNSRYELLKLSKTAVVAAEKQRAALLQLDLERLALRRLIAEGIAEQKATGASITNETKSGANRHFRTDSPNSQDDQPLLLSHEQRIFMAALELESKALKRREAALRTALLKEKLRGVLLASLVVRERAQRSSTQDAKQNPGPQNRG